MRHFAFQMLDWLGALSQIVSAGEVEEFEIVAIFCGAGLDVSLLCLVNGWFETLTR